MQETRAIQSALKKELWSFRRRRRAVARKEFSNEKVPALARKYWNLLGLNSKKGRLTGIAIRRALVDKLDRDRGDDFVVEG